MEKFYHFTTIDALVSMLTNSLVIDGGTKQRYLELWATEITALNDTTERDLFVNVLINEVKRYANNQQNRLTEEQEMILGKLCYSDMYVISLSDKELSLADELNMWRGYGGNGYGACLEFDFSKVQPFYSVTKDILQLEDAFILRKCEYVTAEEIKIEQELIRLIYRAIDNPEKDYLKKILTEAGVMARVACVSPYYKHKAYESEHEWRIVKHSMEEPKFRTKAFIPYITYRIPINAISSIKIGPCVKDTDYTQRLEQFIRKKLGQQIAITYSEIPYRG